MNRRDDLDVDDVMFVVGDNLGLADSAITAAERLLGQPGAAIDAVDDAGDYDQESCDDDDDPGRIVNHLAHLIAAGKMAVRAAQYAHSQAEAKINAFCQTPSHAVEITTTSRKRGRA